MKKIVCILLVVVMMFALAIGASAAISSSGGSEGQDVKIEIIEINDSEVIYSVDISWPNLNFTYNHGTGTWNPGTHQYDQSGQAWVTTAHHSAIPDGLKTTDITVTNHSNAAVWYTAEYSGGALNHYDVDVTLTGDITGIELTSAVGVLPVNNAAKGAFQVQVKGTPNVPVLDSTKIGTVTVSISPNP